MYPHPIASIEKLKEYFQGKEGVIAAVLDGSIVKGNERPDSDVDAIIVVTPEKYAELAAENKLAEVITGHCTYEGGYFDIKYKTKAQLCAAAKHASEPTRNAYVKAQVLFSSDPAIAPLVAEIAAYPEHELAAKIECFNADLQLNYGYFLRCVPEDNAYMQTGNFSPATGDWKRRWQSAKSAPPISLSSAPPSSKRSRPKNATPSCRRSRRKPRCRCATT